MTGKISAACAVLVVGAAFAAVPALAATKHHVKHHLAQRALYASTNPTVTYSGMGPEGAPLSPGGISAAANAMRGPGYSGPAQTGQYTAPSYATAGSNGAPLSPGGISAAASAYGGPGYGGPAQSGKYAAPSYSTTGANGAPLSPNGISAAASAFGGPGYNGR